MCTAALEFIPDFCLLQIDFANVHTYNSRGEIWEELEIYTFFHFLIQLFICLYGDNCTPQANFSNGPHKLPTDMHMLGDGLRQGETAANVFFNILAARLYKAFMKIIDECGTLFPLAEDGNIAETPAVLAEIVAKLPAKLPGLTTQASKYRFYVQLSAREAWALYLYDNPRSTYLPILCLYEISDGRNSPPEENVDFSYDHSVGSTWPDNDGVNILCTPLGSPAFVEDYLGNKLKKHKLLLSSS